MKIGIRTMFAAILVAISISLMIADIAAAKDLQEYRTEGIRAIKAGQHQEALKLWKAGLKLAVEEKSEKMQGSFLANLGHVYRIIGIYDEALVHCEKAAAIFRKIKDLKREAIVLVTLGRIYASLGQNQNSIEHFQQALSIHRRIKDRKGEGENLGNIGVVYKILGQYEKALSYHQKSLAIYRKIGDVKGEGKNLGSIGVVYENLGQYEKALSYHQKSLAINRKIGNVKGEGKVFGNIGNVYVNLGQYEKALSYHQKSLAIYRKIGNVKGEGVPLGNIGNVYVNLGQYEKALSHYQKSLAINRKIGNVKGEGVPLGNIGVVYEILGQYEKALSYHQKSLAIYRKIGNVKGEGVPLGNIGNVYVNLGRYKKALSHYQKSLAIIRKTGDVKGEGAVLGNIGVVYKDLGQYEKALSYHQKSLAIKRRIGDVKGEGENLGNIGVAYEILGQYEKALSHYQKSLAIIRKIGDVKGEGIVLGNIGFTMLSAGKPAQAETYLESAIEVWESIRRQVKTGTERTGFQSTLPNVYGNLATARLAQGKQQGAFEAVERGRAKSFLDLLGTRGAGGRRSKKKTAQIASIEMQLSGLREKHVELASVPVGAKTRSVRKAVNQEISALDRKRLGLIGQIRRADPELGSLMVVDPPNLKEIQSLLSPGTAMVEYFHPGKKTVSGKKQDQLWIFVLLSDSFHFKSVDVPRPDLRKALDEYARLVADEASDPLAVESAGSKLYKWLIEPVEPITQVRNADTLIIVPWGPMFKIPFSALAPKGGKPLVADKNLVTAPSAGVYRYLIKKRSLRRKNILSIGNPETTMAPLQGAEKEAKEIAELFGKSIVRTRSKATESLIKSDYEALGKPDIVHLACHGIFNERVPQLSHLALTPDQKNDGKLEMHEIFDLDWRGVSLVTLSACSSGKGKLASGNDLVGLTRGFMFAGAPSILCSLWDVDDEATRALMVSFYKNYLGGMSKPESLRKAQVTMQKSKKWSHPYYWSAFVLFGDWE